MLEPTERLNLLDPGRHPRRRLDAGPGRTHQADGELTRIGGWQKLGPETEQEPDTSGGEKHGQDHDGERPSEQHRPVLI